MILIIFIVVLMIVFVFAFCEAENYMNEQQQKRNSKNSQTYGIHYRPIVNNPSVQSIIEEKPKYETTTFNIAGVTFTDGRFKRQTALRMLKFKDEPMDGNILFEFEQYDYEDKQAVRIIANDRILGNVPAANVDDFIKKMETHSDYDIDYEVKGGGDYPFGCTMTFTWK